MKKFLPNALLLASLLLNFSLLRSIKNHKEEFPFWGNGIANVSSHMIGRNEKWLQESKDRKFIAERNIVFFRALIDYIRAQKERYK